MRSLTLLPALGLLALAASALAQYSVRNIEIHGAAPYSNEEILQVSGLRPGQMLSHNSLADADQHLMDTGLFADAEVGLTGAGMARTAVIELKARPLASLIPATFVNFPWWTPAELDAALRKSVPLYRGAIPTAGNLPDTVDAALTSMLAAKGIHAAVSNAFVFATDLRPRPTWQFHIDSPTITVASINLTGAPAALDPAIQHVIQNAAGDLYDSRSIADALFVPLRNAGYIDAQLSNVTTTVDPSASGYSVHYNATVIPGDVFHVSAISWTPTTIYAQDAFTHDAKLHPADIAAQDALFNTEQAIVAAYLHLGYLDAFVDAHPQEDKSARTVAYSLAVTPGEIYHVKSVTPLNLSPAALQDFNRGWLLTPGAVYDPLYTTGFLRHNTALRNLDGYAASYQVSADTNTHLVDLTITFTRSAH